MNAITGITRISDELFAYENNIYRIAIAKPAPVVGTQSRELCEKKNVIESEAIRVGGRSIKCWMDNNHSLIYLIKYIFVMPFFIFFHLNRVRCEPQKVHYPLACRWHDTSNDRRLIFHSFSFQENSERERFYSFFHKIP